MEKKKVFVNLEKEKATIITVKTIPLFNNPRKIFIIESDSQGYSGIIKEGDKYRIINAFRNGTVIDDQEITSEKAKKLIRETILHPQHYF